MKRRQLVGSGLALAASAPLRGFGAMLKGVGDVPAKTLAGGATLLHGSSIEALAAGLRGEVLLAGTQDYNQARRVWNASFDKQPALMARCTGAAAAQQAVNFAREHSLLTAVRAGGHSYSGKSSCDGGDHAQGEAWLKKLRVFGKPLRDGIASVPYVALQTSADQLLKSGQYYYLKSGMLTQLEDDGIDLIIDSFKRMPSWYLMFFDHCGGAYRHLAPSATAFPNRDTLFTLGAHSIWPSRDGIEENTARMRPNWRELAPLTKGFYTNYVDSDVTMAGYRDNYGANFERLVALKAKHDPNNLFRLNANLPPKLG
jgi:Berberine and berberine like